MNLQTIVFVWAGTLLLAIGQPLLRHDQLPKQVATSISKEGTPDIYTERTVFVATFSALPILINLLPMVMVGVALRYFPSFVNIPNRTYWTSTPVRRAEARVRYVRGWMAISMVFNLFHASYFDLIVRVNLTGDGSDKILNYVIAVCLGELGAILYLIRLFRIPEEKSHGYELPVGRA